MEMSDQPYLRRIELKRGQIPDTGVYPFNIPAIQRLESLEFHPAVTFFVGENGTGKSTLIEAIAVALGFNAEGGTKNSTFSTRRTESELSRFLKTVKSFKHPKDGFFLRAESFYNLASLMDDVGYLQAYGGRSLHQQSHGEAFMATLLNKLRGNGLYIFDEPEAALSPSRQLSALVALHDLVKKNSQFIISTHSPILLAYPHAKIYQFSEFGVQEVSYEDTEHYSVTRRFLVNPGEEVKRLLED